MYFVVIYFFETFSAVVASWCKIQYGSHRLLTSLRKTLAVSQKAAAKNKEKAEGSAH